VVVEWLVGRDDVVAIVVGRREVAGWEGVDLEEEDSVNEISYRGL
jgi:hypothetical protein